MKKLKKKLKPMSTTSLNPASPPNVEMTVMLWLNSSKMNVSPPFSEPLKKMLKKPLKKSKKPMKKKKKKEEEEDTELINLYFITFEFTNTFFRAKKFKY